MNPLTGGAAEAAAWVLLKLGEDGNAKKYLLNAVEATSRQQNGWGDGEDSEAPALASAARLVDQVLEVHRRTEDREGLAPYLAPVEELCASASRRLGLPGGRQDALLHERLISSSVLVLVASGAPDAPSRAQRLLQVHLGDSPPRTQQAQLCTAMFRSLRGGGSASAVLANAVAGAGLSASEASTAAGGRTAAGARLARSGGRTVGGALALAAGAGTVLCAPHAAGCSRAAPLRVAAIPPAGGHARWPAAAALVAAAPPPRPWLGRMLRPAAARGAVAAAVGAAGSRR
mmetsp:Transcript_52677/g.163611  ORF Transcript_52677/g.163611 Transcript_52677/m.163611 type:complete len:288 (+) Transcript_52677:3-866(+)